MMVSDGFVLFCFVFRTVFISSHSYFFTLSGCITSRKGPLAPRRRKWVPISDLLCWKVVQQGWRSSGKLWTQGRQARGGDPALWDPPGFSDREAELLASPTWLPACIPELEMSSSERKELIKMSATVWAWGICIFSEQNIWEKANIHESILSWHHHLLWLTVCMCDLSHPLCTLSTVQYTWRTSFLLVVHHLPFYKKAG